VLLLLSTAFALASTGSARGVAATARVAKHDRQVLRFFAHHPWLLRDPRFAAEAKRQVAAHRKSLAAAQRRLAAHRARTRRTLARHLASVRARDPETVICRVFRKHCHEALRVARCESGLRTDAVNGQYLGLFQMGSTARQLYGHGDSADEQARAAHRYFVAAGHSWGPWTCRP